MSVLIRRDKGCLTKQLTEIDDIFELFWVFVSVGTLFSSRIMVIKRRFSKIFRTLHYYKGNPEI